MARGLAHRLPVAKLEKLFALLMVVMASQLLIKALASVVSPPGGLVHRPCIWLAVGAGLQAQFTPYGVHPRLDRGIHHNRRAHSREVSPGCLLVASSPILPPSPENRAGRKSR